MAKRDKMEVAFPFNYYNNYNNPITPQTPISKHQYNNSIQSINFMLHNYFFQSRKQLFFFFSGIFFFLFLFIKEGKEKRENVQNNDCNGKEY